MLEFFGRRLGILQGHDPDADEALRHHADESRHLLVAGARDLRPSRAFAQ